MASCASGLSKFRLYWEGPYTCQGGVGKWNISVIEIVMYEGQSRIRAAIDLLQDPHAIQRLRLHKIDKAKEAEAVVLTSFLYASQNARDMQVIVEKTRAQDQVSMETKNPTQRKSCSRFAQSTSVFIALKGADLIAPGKTYGIYIRHREPEIEASVEPIQDAEAFECATLVQALEKRRLYYQQELEATHQSLIFYILTEEFGSHWLEKYDPADFERLIHEGTEEAKTKDAPSSVLWHHAIAILNMCRELRLKTQQIEPVLDAVTKKDFDRAFQIVTSIGDRNLKNMGCTTLLKGCIEADRYPDAKRALDLIPKDFAGRQECVSVYRQYAPQEKTEEVELGLDQVDLKDEMQLRDLVEDAVSDLRFEKHPGIVYLKLRQKCLDQFSITDMQRMIAQRDDVLALNPFDCLLPFRLDSVVYVLTRSILFKQQLMLVGPIRDHINADRYEEAFTQLDTLDYEIKCGVLMLIIERSRSRQQWALAKQACDLFPGEHHFKTEVLKECQHHLSKA